MKGFMIKILLVSLMTSVLAMDSNPIASLIQQRKAQRANGFITNEPILRAHGSGVTDGQETQTEGFVDQAFKSFGGDQYSNAIFIQQKVEDAFGGRWNVEVFGGDPSWGRATYLKNDQWILFFSYGDQEWDYIIWAPDC